MPSAGPEDGRFRAWPALLLPPLLGTVLVLAASLNDCWGLGLSLGLVAALAALGTALALPLVLCPASWAALPLLAGGLFALARFSHGAFSRWIAGGWIIVQRLSLALQGWLEQRVLLVDRPEAALLLALACLGLGVAFSYLGLRRRDPMVVLILGALVITLEWVFYFDRAPGYLGWYLCAGLALCAAGHLEARRWAWRRRGVRQQYFSPWPGAASALLLSLALVAASGLMPHQVRPFDWKRAGEVLTDLFPILERARGPEGGAAAQFSLGAVGLGQTDEELGGPARPSAGQALWLRAWGECPYSTLYLRGVARDLYTGRGWRRGGLRFTAQGRDMLPSEFDTAVPLVKLTLEVELEGLETSTLFCALEPARAELVEGRYFADETLTLVAPSTGRRGRRYVTYARVPVVRLEALLARVPSGPEFSKALPAWAGRYLQLPARLPARVRELAAEAARGASHPVEQALKLEGWLRELPYALTAPEPPPGRDFVDFFLFDARQGYCTYHSTAMAVMLRCLGIPARWVEGFAVAVEPGAQDGNPIAVRHASAHSWVEAYFPGWGWVIFEPTPAYPVAEAVEAAAPPPAAPPPPGPPSPGGAGPIDEDVFPSEEAWPGAPRPARRPAWPWVGLGGGAAAAAGLLAWTGAAAAEARRRERLPEAARKDPRLQARHYFALADDLLRRCGLPRGPGQTPLEFARWAAASLGEPAAGRLSELAGLYCRARYAPERPPGHPQPLGPAEADRCRRAFADLAAWARRRWGWLGYQRRRLFGPPRRGRGAADALPGLQAAGGDGGRRA
ncbi:MAG: transglutaminase domain-containing protein [Acetobacteraceae bacterium]|nr:transglutaminase domain-containing protein [Acetobacteraceae bacterium]